MEEQAASDPSVPGDADETELAEHRTTPVELLWDLVFVFAVTEVSSLM